MSGVKGAFYENKDEGVLQVKMNTASSENLM